MNVARRGFVVMAVGVVLLALLACKENAAPSAGAGGGTGGGARLKVLATTGMIADVARNIAGERAEVTALMGEGVDPHLYKASPGDVRLMSDADVIFYNGLHLEGRMADVIVKMAQKQTVVRVTEGIDESRLREPPEFAGHFDPHVWFDVMLWAEAADRVRDALVEKDPAGRGVYEANAGRYLAELRALDAYARATIATIPEGNRVMVTAHDAFGYFGAAYGLRVLGVQGISTDSEASLQDINALVDMLVEGKVPAVFIESTVSRKTIDALIEGCRARGHTVTVGGELFSDAMGAEGTAEGTYIGMVRHNVDTVARALGGRVPPTAAPAPSTPGTDAPAKTNP
jgi:manganese/zinc/iron transport system substrate-binding protein